jgi:hypothetical protein
MSYKQFGTSTSTTSTTKKPTLLEQVNLHYLGGIDEIDDIYETIELEKNLMDDLDGVETEQQGENEQETQEKPEQPGNQEKPESTESTSDSDDSDSEVDSYVSGTNEICPCKCSNCGCSCGCNSSRNTSVTSVTESICKIVESFNENVNNLWSQIQVIGETTYTLKEIVLISMCSKVIGDSLTYYSEMYFSK